MADSNRCQAVGHVGENQEYLVSFFDAFDANTFPYVT